MKTLKTLPLVASLALFACLGANAATLGPAFTYQGKLSIGNDASSGRYDFSFAVFNDPGAGTQQGVTVATNAVAVTNGYFVVELNFGSIFDGQERWLEISVRTNGATSYSTLTPRQRLTAAPYASYAPQAGAAGVAGSVVAGGVTASALATGAVTADKIAPGAVSQLGAPDGSPLNAVSVNTNGAVGVGTSTPAAGLQVALGVTNLVPALARELIDNIGPYTNLGGAISVSVSGNLLALGAAIDNGVTLVDISSPSAPVFRWSVTDGTGSFTDLATVRGVALSGSLLAVAAQSDNAVTLVDVSTPTAPVIRATLKDGVGSYTSLGGAWAVQLSSNLLAIAAFTDNAFTLVDVTTPASPVFKIAIADGQLGFNDLAGPVALARSGNLLAIAASLDNAIVLVDVSNPSNPILKATLKDGVGAYTNLAYPQGLAFSGNLLAIAAQTDNAVTLVDVTTPTAPVLKASLKNGQAGFTSLAGANTVQFQGNLLWIGAPDNLTAVDVSDPSAPVLKAVVSNGTRGFSRMAASCSLAVSGSNVIFGGSSAATLLNGTTTGTAGLVSDNWVGIGTSQPAAPLDVNGSVIVENASTLMIQGPQMSIHSGKTGLRGQASGWAPNESGIEAGIFIEGGVSSGDGGGFYADGDVAVIWSPGDLDILRVYDEDDLPNGLPKFVINPAGRVGILTNKPQSALHVVGDLTIGNVNAAGTVTAAGFQGSGAGLTGLTAASLASGSVTNAVNFLASAGVGIGTASPQGALLDVEGDIRLNLHDLLFAGGTDFLHGVGWYGAGKLFAGVNVNGPVLYGNGGGALGARSGTTNIALQWDASRNVTIPGTLNASGTVQFTGSAFLNDKDLQLRNDSNHGLGWYGGTKPFAGFTPDGPVLYGCGGGILGTACGTPHATLTWDSSSVNVYGTLGATNSLVVDSTARNNGALTPGLVFGGGGNGEGISSKRTTGGNQYGLDFYTAGAARMSVDNAGRVGIGTTSPSDCTLDVRGDLRLNDCQLLLRGGTDRNHGLKWFGAGGWMPTIGWDGPVLYGYNGGLLGTTSGGHQWALSWSSSGDVGVYGSVYQGSDRAIKTDFATVDCGEVLQKVLTLPMQTWRYLTEPQDVRHLGPVAQDFRAAFGLGKDDKTIAIVDATGTAMAAIQGLNQKLEEKDARIKALEARLEKLEQLMNARNGGGQ